MYTPSTIELSEKDKRANAIQASAHKLKLAVLKRSPFMDPVAIALNSAPTWDEIQSMRRHWEAIEAAGYKICKGEE